MIADGVRQAGERAVVHERWLQRDITQRRSAKPVAVRWVARDLLTAIVFIGAWAIKDNVAQLRRDLRNPGDMVLKVAKHLIRLSGNAMAHDTAGLTEKQQCALLFVIGQRVPLAASELIDGRIVEGQAELKFGNSLPKHVKGNGRAGPDSWKETAK